MHGRVKQFLVLGPVSDVCVCVVCVVCAFGFRLFTRKCWISYINFIINEILIGKFKKYSQMNICDLQ